MSSSKSWEAAALDAQPSLREEINESSEFEEWRAALPNFEMDGETFYLPWGDVPMDEDQVAYYWARSKGLVPSDDQTAEPS